MGRRYLFEQCRAAKRRPTSDAKRQRAPAQIAIMQGMRIVVDNSAGGDAQLADQVAQGLRDRGLEVELRAPRPGAMFDTAVDLVSAGMVIRVSERPDRPLLDTVATVVRAALQHRTSLRRRTRTVPVNLGESRRVIEWIDVFDA
jgi:hypothetical protein